MTNKKIIEHLSECLPTHFRDMVKDYLPFQPLLVVDKSSYFSEIDRLFYEVNHSENNPENAQIYWNQIYKRLFTTLIYSSQMQVSNTSSLFHHFYLKIEEAGTDFLSYEFLLHLNLLKKGLKIRLGIATEQDITILNQYINIPGYVAESFASLLVLLKEEELHDFFAHYSDYLELLNSNEFILFSRVLFSGYRNITPNLIIDLLGENPDLWESLHVMSQKRSDLFEQDYFSLILFGLLPGNRYSKDILEIVLNIILTFSEVRADLFTLEYIERITSESLSNPSSDKTISILQKIKLNLEKNRPDLVEAINETYIPYLILKFSKSNGYSLNHKISLLIKANMLNDNHLNLIQNVVHHGANDDVKKNALRFILEAKSGLEIDLNEENITEIINRLFIDTSLPKSEDLIWHISDYKIKQMCDLAMYSQDLYKYLRQYIPNLIMAQKITRFNLRKEAQKSLNIIGKCFPDLIEEKYLADLQSLLNLPIYGNSDVYHIHKAAANTLRIIIDLNPHFITKLPRNTIDKLMTSVYINQNDYIFFPEQKKMLSSIVSSLQHFELFDRAYLQNILNLFNLQYFIVIESVIPALEIIIDTHSHLFTAQDYACLLSYGLREINFSKSYPKLINKILISLLKEHPEWINFQIIGFGSFLELNDKSKIYILDICSVLIGKNPIVDQALFQVLDLNFIINLAGNLEFTNNNDLQYALGEIIYKFILFFPQVLENNVLKAKLLTHNEKKITHSNLKAILLDKGIIHSTKADIIALNLNDLKSRNKEIAQFTIFHEAAQVKALIKNCQKEMSEALQDFKPTVNRLIEKSLIKPKYLDVASQAQKLYRDLEDVLHHTFFVYPTRSQCLDFINTRDKAIQSVKRSFIIHRSLWGQLNDVYKKIIGVLVCLMFFPVVLLDLAYHRGNIKKGIIGTFFYKQKTRSSEELDTLENTLMGIQDDIEQILPSKLA